MEKKLGFRHFRPVLNFAKISVLCLQMLVKNGILSVYELQEKYENRQH